MFRVGIFEVFSREKIKPRNISEFDKSKLKFAMKA